MGYYKLSRVLGDLAKNLNRTEALAAAAHQWTSVRRPLGVPVFSREHERIVTELAFLRAFMAWEAFLQDSFVLYLLGKRPAKGRAPKRYVCPRNRKIAEQLILPEHREHADWTTPGTVSKRAKRFFHNGEPYAPVLRSQQSRLQDLKTIRNAIAHSSTSSQEKFKSLVRRELPPPRPNPTVGGFLAMTVPGSSPPQSFLELYLVEIRLAAERIVPR